MALLETIISDVNTTWKDNMAQIPQKLQEVLMIQKKKKQEISVDSTVT